MFRDATAVTWPSKTKLQNSADNLAMRVNLAGWVLWLFFTISLAFLDSSWNAPHILRSIFNFLVNFGVLSGGIYFSAQLLERPDRKNALWMWVVCWVAFWQFFLRFGIPKLVISDVIELSIPTEMDQALMDEPGQLFDNLMRLPFFFFCLGSVILCPCYAIIFGRGKNHVAAQK